MGIIKTRKPAFKNNNGEMDTGGAPIYADDFLTIQENAAADIVNYFESLRRLLPPLELYQGPSTPAAPEFENGIILSGCEYDNSTLTDPVLSPGYILSGGEICYFPGGTFSTGPAQPGLIYLFKGSPIYTNRVFNDGGNKEILVKYDCVVEQSYIGAQGPVLIPGTAITPTTQVVAISCGNSSDAYNIAERYFHPQAAFDLPDIKKRLNKSTWSPALSLGTGVSFDPGVSPFLVSRVDAEGFTEITGSVKIDFAAIQGPNPIIATLAAHGIATGNSVAIFGNFSSTSLDFQTKLWVNLFGAIILNDSVTNFPTSGTGQLFINAKVWGKNGAPVAEADFKQNFLEI